MQTYGTLYLLPVGLGECNLEDVLPKRNFDLVKTLTYFIAENAKEARAFLKQCAYPEISRAQLSLINQHVNADELNDFIAPLLEGKDMGLMSDAGCPGIADPGSEIIRLAHRKGIKVTPLIGPSSIVLSIMASGFNGQNFAFVGYLPSDAALLVKRIKELEQLAMKTGQTQLFIETPYRNASLLQVLISQLQPNTCLAISCGLTLIHSQTLSEKIYAWRQKPHTLSLNFPSVFAIG